MIRAAARVAPPGRARGRHPGAAPLPCKIIGNFPPIYRNARAAVKKFTKFLNKNWRLTFDLHFRKSRYEKGGNLRAIGPARKFRK
jgi:hypothetical protein